MNTGEGYRYESIEMEKNLERVGGKLNTIRIYFMKIIDF